MSSEHVAAPIDFRIGTKTYTLTPLTIRSLKQLERMLQADVMAAAKQDVEGLPLAMQEAILTRAYDDSRKIKIGTKEFDAASQSPSGLAAMFYLLLRPTHQDVTPDAAADLLDGPHLSKLVEAINQAAGYRSDDASPNGGSLPATTPTGS